MRAGLLARSCFAPLTDANVRKIWETGFSEVTPGILDKDVTGGQAERKAPLARILTSILSSGWVGGADTGAPRLLLIPLKIFACEYTPDPPARGDLPRCASEISPYACCTAQAQSPPAEPNCVWVSRDRCSCLMSLCPRLLLNLIGAGPAGQRARGLTPHANTCESAHLSVDFRPGSWQAVMGVEGTLGVAGHR